MEQVILDHLYGSTDHLYRSTDHLHRSTDHLHDSNSLTSLFGIFPNFIFENKNIISSKFSKYIQEFENITSSKIPNSRYRSLVNGKLEGYYLRFYPNGNIADIEKHHDNLLEGKSISWDNTGAIKTIKNYRKNLLNGVVKTRLYRINGYQDSIFRKGEEIIELRNYYQGEISNL